MQRCPLEATAIALYHNSAAQWLPLPLPPARDELSLRSAAAVRHQSSAH